MFNSLTAKEGLQEVLQHYISITNLNFKEKYLEREEKKRKEGKHNIGKEQKEDMLLWSE